MPDEQAIWLCHRVIPSEASAGRRIQDEVLEQLAQHGWPEHDIFAVRLAMEEAVVNAIKHGNFSDPSKCVRIEARLFSARLTLEIADEGQGFDPAGLPDPHDPANLDMPCGRGVTLMRSFMTRVEFNETGNRVLLEKLRGASN